MRDAGAQLLDGLRPPGATCPLGETRSADRRGIERSPAFESIELARVGEGYRVVRRFPRRQSAALRLTAKGVERSPLGASLPELPESAALAIAAGLDALERAQGQALDVEWAVRKGRVDFRQARAQTRSLDFELAPGQVWTRANARDVFPELTSALVAR